MFHSRLRGSFEDVFGVTFGPHLDEEALEAEQLARVNKAVIRRSYIQGLRNEAQISRRQWTWDPRAGEMVMVSRNT
jgi:hypothetical protein